MDSRLSELTKLIEVFVDERDWKQFHDPKDLAISLCLEASEVLEQYQWKTNDNINKEAVAKELADVLYWILLMSSKLEIDLDKVFRDKMVENKKKYPVAKSKGNSKKYTEL